MKKIPLLVVAAFVAMCSFAYELPSDAVRIYNLEQTFAPGDGGSYKYTTVFVAADFEDADEVLSEAYNGLALTFTGEIYQLRFDVESFVEGVAQANNTPVTWIHNDDDGNVILTSLEGTVPATAETETTVYLKLTDDILERFADGDAIFHVHYGDQGSTGSLTITEAYLFKVLEVNVAEVEADKGAVVSVEYYSILGAKLPSTAKGLVIEKTTYENGSVESKKVVIE